MLSRSACWIMTLTSGPATGQVVAHKWPPAAGSFNMCCLQCCKALAACHLTGCQGNMVFQVLTHGCGRRLQHLQNLYQRGEVSRIAWLDPLTLDHIQGLCAQVGVAACAARCLLAASSCQGMLRIARLIHFQSQAQAEVAGLTSAHLFGCDLHSWFSSYPAAFPDPTPSSKQASSWVPAAFWL